MPSVNNYDKPGRLKIVKFSGTDLIVQCSAINKSNHTSTSPLGWNRAGNTSDERIVASSTSDNWRTCIRVKKDLLRQYINGPVVGVKLEVNPIQEKTCQPYNTQAVLTDKLYSAAANNLLDTYWCSQGKIYDSKGAARSGDIGLNLSNSGALSVFGGGHMVTAQRACVGSDTSGYSITTYKGSNPGTLCYLFSDSATDPSPKWGDASVNKSRIGYTQVSHQTLENMFDGVMASDNDNDQVCFYLTRYKNAEKSSYGYGGWIYSDYLNSWSVYVVYADQVSVKIPLYINGHDASKDSLVTDYLLTSKHGGPYVKIVVSTDGIKYEFLPSYNPSTTYNLPYGSTIAVLIDGTMAQHTLRVSSDSDVSDGEFRDITDTMNLRLELRAGVTFIDPTLKFESRPTYCEYNRIEGYYGGDPVPLPITPGWDKLKGLCAPSSIYYTCGKLEVSDDYLLDNVSGLDYYIPDVYDSWKNDPTVDTCTTVVRNISAVTYRNYKCKFIVCLPDGTKREDTDSSLTQTFILKPSDMKGYPKVVNSFLEKTEDEYRGAQVNCYLTNVGGIVVENSTPMWDDILFYASDVATSESNDPIEITVEARIEFDPSVMHCFYKDRNNNLYRAIYYDGENAYQAVLKK